mmetsp:Transcript_20082/g.29042  ORF Transcript_20082/g.29042 Transcript_20082/m.29042 type:complete len:137 (+) Transcript_20082:131-541(+)
MILNFLLFFFNKKTLSIRGSVTEISKSMSLPKDVCQEFLNIFTEKSAKNLYRATKQDNDKCMIYILILYVMANSPSTIQVSDVEPISRELKLEISKTSNMLREAGFTVAKKGASTGAVLNVPLTFPPPKRRGRGGK